MVNYVFLKILFVIICPWNLGFYKKQEDKLVLNQLSLETFLKSKKQSESYTQLKFR